MYGTYNVTFRRVRATIVAVEKQWVLHNVCVYVCVCTCGQGIQHAMRIYGLPRSTIFFHIIS
jgi:hypothetical protein